MCHGRLRRGRRWCRGDGLVRTLTAGGIPIGTLGAGIEFVSPSLSTVVRVESIDTHSARVRVWRLPSSGSRNIRIATVLFDPVGPEPKGEYVLIENDRATAADLTGWTLADAIQHTYAFSAFPLVPGATVRVWTGTGTDDGENVYWGRHQAVWNNTGDTAILRDAAGNEISRFAYTA
jgi:hypothetical protein